MARKQAPSRTDNEWFELIMECRKSGLSDTAWCQAKSIPVGTFYCAVNRLRKKNYTLPKSNSVTNTTLDLTAKQDVVQIDIEEKSSLTASKPAQQVAKTYLGNSHTIKIDVHGIGISVSNEADPQLLKVILLTLGSCLC